MSNSAPMWGIGGSILGAVVSQLVPRRKVRLDEFVAIKDELHTAIGELRDEVAEKTHRIEHLEREVQACETGRAEDRVEFMHRINELAMALVGRSSSVMVRSNPTEAG